MQFQFPTWSRIMHFSRYLFYLFEQPYTHSMTSEVPSLRSSAFQTAGLCCWTSAQPSGRFPGRCLVADQASASWHYTHARRTKLSQACRVISTHKSSYRLYLSCHLLFNKLCSGMQLLPEMVSIVQCITFPALSKPLYTKLTYRKKGLSQKPLQAVFSFVCSKISLWLEPWVFMIKAK